MAKVKNTQEYPEPRIPGEIKQDISDLETQLATLKLELRKAEEYEKQIVEVDKVTERSTSKPLMSVTNGVWHPWNSGKDPQIHLWANGPLASSHIADFDGGLCFQ